MSKCERKPITDAQLERLAILAEECGEVVKVVGKILRHGLGSINPLTGESNRHLLEKELGDVLAAMELLVINDEVHMKDIYEHSDAKFDKLQDPNYPFVHFQAE